MLHPTGLPGVSCQQGISIPPQSCVNKLHEIPFTDYPTNIYPWSCSKPILKMPQWPWLWIGCPCICTGHLDIWSCKAGSIKSHPLKTEAGWAELPLYLRHRELHLARVNSETYRKSWIQNSSCSPWPVLHPSQCSHLFLFRYVYNAYIHTTKNNLIIMHTLFFCFFLIYFHHQRTHSVILLCACVSVSKSVVMIRTCRQKKKNSLSFCFLPLCLALAAAATPVCAFVTVATDSKGKARQRCSIAVDLKSKGGGGVEGWVVMGSGWGVVALWHTHN